MLVLCSRQKGQEDALSVFATEQGLTGFERAAEDFAAKYNARELRENPEQEPARMRPSLTLKERLEDRWQQRYSAREAERLHQHRTQQRVRPSLSRSMG